MKRLPILATILSVAAYAGAAQAGELTYFTTVTDTDVANFGIGTLRDAGTGSLTVTGLTGTVSSAYLFWHGPTNSTDPLVNASVSFGGSAVTGTNIGFSSDNFWGYTNSQAYRADVSTIISGNGVYALADFITGAPNSVGSANINGASLVVFYNDGDDANNRDVVLFNGNDGNFDNPFDAPGWNAALNDIDYSGGSVGLTLHVSDGQFVFEDGDLSVNGDVIASGNIFGGLNAQVGNGNAGTGGGLWDVNTFDITGLFTPGLNDLTVTLPGFNDALGLIVAQFDLPAGAAPPMPGVPEPSTWAMLIGGMGVAGGALRRRRRVAAFA